jgi:chromosome segregation ATPase
MENATVVEMISSLGFPIVICLALCYFIYKLWEQSVAREEKLMAEITENRLVNEKAVETIAKFAERFTHIEEDVTEIKNDVVLIKDKLN